MLEVPHARRLILEQATVLSPSQMHLSAAHGLVLGEDITSDVDSPPHDKSMMDGYAVRVADVSQVGVTLPITQRIMAGMTPTGPVAAGTAAQVMTGAPIPDGTDAVIMVERTTSEGDHVTFKEVPRLGQNIMRRGTSIQRGQIVLHAGQVLTPARIGLCAEVGHPTVAVYPRPTVGIISTGNELVPINQTPAAGQIRNSNSIMLSAAVARAGGVAQDYGIVPDERETMTETLRSAIEQHDVVILSGGVSAGVLDLVPSVLESLGVRAIFHKIRMKPGKPLWFGVYERATGQRTLVFGLPGNPVSSAVCFEIFVRPALDQLRGLTATIEVLTRTAQLSETFRIKTDRPTYWPGVWVDQQHTQVRALPWQGSADLAGFAQQECLLAFDAGEQEYPVGTTVNVVG
jgi:molybdopterin molybdotransferase